MHYYDLPGLSAMFLDWDPADCNGKRFMALEMLNSLLNYYQNGSLPYRLNLIFIMDHRQIKDDIEKAYAIRIEKFNFFRQAVFFFKFVYL